MRTPALAAVGLLILLASPAAAVPVDVVFQGFAGPARVGEPVFAVGTPLDIRIRVEDSTPGIVYEPRHVFYSESILEVEIIPDMGSSILASGGFPGFAAVKDDWVVPIPCIPSPCSPILTQDELLVFHGGPLEGPVPDGAEEIFLDFSPPGGTLAQPVEAQMLTSTALPTAPFDYGKVSVSFGATGSFNVWPTLAEAVPEPAPVALAAAALVALRRRLG